MNILLIQPQKPPSAVGGEDLAIFEPLALEYLAAGVPDKHNVRILDMRLDRDFDATMNGFQPDIVGITAYTVHVNVAKELFRRIKEYNPEICTVVGGHHATVMPGDFTTPHVDVIITGEGVTSFRDLIECLDSGRSIKELGGASLSENRTVVIMTDHASVDLDALPFPRRELTASYRKEYFSEWMKPLASIRTSKGCRFRCKFCALWKLTGGKYLTRSPEAIVKELATINEENVFFADDESLLDRERMSILAELIEKEGIRKRYFLYGRSDTIVKNPGLLEKWKKIGLTRVFVGLEFFKNDDLQMIRKGSTTENNIEAVRILKSLDIDIFPNFMIRPEYGHDDFREFRKYCLKLNLDFIGFSVMTPLPGTDLYDEVKDKLIVHNYDYYDFFHTLLPTRLPLKDFYKEYVSLFSKTRSMKNQIAFIRKYPIWEIPSLFKVFNKFTRQIQMIEKDYLH